MGIEHMYNATAVTYREDFVTPGGVKKALVGYLDTFSCHVQPFEPSIGSDMPGSFGKRWVMFCPVADFKEGDKVIVDGTDEYRIVGVETYNFSNNPHAEVVLKAFKE